MNFSHFNLGYRRAGEIVEVRLRGKAANVQLMDSNNFANYRSGRRYRYWGGLVTRSPYIVEIPRSGNWHVAIDLGGDLGRVNAHVQVLQGYLAIA